MCISADADDRVFCVARPSYFPSMELDCATGVPDEILRARSLAGFVGSGCERAGGAQNMCNWKYTFLKSVGL